MPPISKKIKISVVSYLNTLPFRWAMRHSDLHNEAVVSEDMPSLCAEKLLKGEVDLALVPVAVIPQMQDYHIVSDYCIGADGMVDSVKLYHQVPVRQISKVLLDYQSRTSVALAQVLFRFWWKNEPEFVHATAGFEEKVSETTAAVVIGDRTFDLNGRYLYETDLAESWKNFTRLPFVFAAWVSRKELPADFVARFNGILREGVNNIENAVSEAPDHPLLPKAVLADYLRYRIDYRLDDKKREAMALFHDYLSRL